MAKDIRKIPLAFTELKGNLSGTSGPEKRPMKVSGITAHLGWHQSVVFSAVVLNPVQSTGPA